jgi:hypothetical protein
MDSSKQKKTPVDIHSFDLDSGRTAMHKAAFCEQQPRPRPPPIAHEHAHLPSAHHHTNRHCREHGHRRCASALPTPPRVTWTRSHLALAGGHNHVINFLTSSCCARVGDVDFAGDTPMHDAARFGHVDIVRSPAPLHAAPTARRSRCTPLPLHTQSSSHRALRTALFAPRSSHRARLTAGAAVCVAGPLAAARWCRLLRTQPRGRHAVDARRAPWQARRHRRAQGARSGRARRRRRVTAQVVPARWSASAARADEELSETESERATCAMRVRRVCYYGSDEARLSAHCMVGECTTGALLE